MLWQWREWLSCYCHTTWSTWLEVFPSGSCFISFIHSNPVVIHTNSGNWYCNLLLSIKVQQDGSYWITISKQTRNSNWRKPLPIAISAVAVYVGHHPLPFWQWLQATIKPAMGSGLQQATWTATAKRAMGGGLCYRHGGCCFCESPKSRSRWRHACYCLGQSDLVSLRIRIKDPQSVSSWWGSAAGMRRCCQQAVTGIKGDSSGCRV